ncbi:DUF935 domain-containing protein [Arsukibacterium sp.]|uniref:DUF935 domain-containing protein n=1 Tax=Arsukibacterium sp. TaxID=1977258 RepID=UPI00299CF52E|nr:DUF935 domain-containing protein [Arsukibacterium sp.]MDX1536389.1 DUF935 domain-containing protein [Arsukibacterium sp.]
MIYEQNGTRFRIREKQLTTKQTQEETAYAAQLRREFADHPSSGLTPAKLANILREAEQGNLLHQCWLAEDMEEKDGHIAAELFKRKMAMSTVPFTVEPPRNASEAEKADAANIADMLRDIEDWEDIIFNLADGVHKGFSNIEYEWQRYGGFQVPCGFEHRPASWFTLDQHNQDKLLLRNGAMGEEMRPLNWLQHKHPAKSGYVARLGLVRQLAWPFIFKNYSVRDLAEFLEIYGIPIRVGKYPSGATDPEKNSLMNAVLSVGHNGAGIMPKGMELDFHEAAKGGGEPFMTMIAWCERIQSKVILGQTLSAEVGNSGSQALGNVHDGIRLDIRDHDLRQLAGTLNRDLIMPMHLLNGKSYTGDPRRKPRIVFDTTEPEDLRALAYPLRAFVGMGMQIGTSWLHEKTKIPQPKEGEPVLKILENAPQLPAQLKGFAALKAETEEQPDTADMLLKQLQSKAKPAVDKLIKPIQDMVDNSNSLEELLDQLLTLEDTLDETELAKVMEQAFAAAEMAGRFDVEQGD